MNYDKLYQLRIRQWALKGIQPYCSWFTKEELDAYFLERDYHDTYS